MCPGGINRFALLVAIGLAIDLIIDQQPGVFPGPLSPPSGGWACGAAPSVKAPRRPRYRASAGGRSLRCSKKGEGGGQTHPGSSPAELRQPTPEVGHASPALSAPPHRVGPH